MSSDHKSDIRPPLSHDPNHDQYDSASVTRQQTREKETFLDNHMAQFRFMQSEADRMKAQVVQMRAKSAEMRAYLAQQWQWLAQYLNVPQITSLPFFDIDFVTANDRPAVLQAVLEAAITLTSANMGNVQLWDPQRHVLQIAAQRGFNQPFLEFFATVSDDRSACGLALQQGSRVIIEDVTASPVFRDSPTLDVMLNAGARAVQSMPLISTSGRMLGVFSTHWHYSRKASERDRQILALIERRTAALLE